MIGPSIEYTELIKKEIQKAYPNYSYSEEYSIGDDKRETLTGYSKEELIALDAIEVSYYDFDKAKVEIESKIDGINPWNTSEEDEALKLRSIEKLKEIKDKIPLIIRLTSSLVIPLIVPLIYGIIESLVYLFRRYIVKREGDEDGDEEFEAPDEYISQKDTNLPKNKF